MEKSEEAPHFNHYSLALKDVFRELLTTSDRASAIVAVAYLDQTIEFLLGMLLPDDPEVTAELERDHLSFRRKIDLLRGRLEIEEEVLADLQRIRKIRNRFAHWYDQVSFETGEVRDWCVALASCRGEASDSDVPRERFTGAVEFICYRLLVQAMMQA